MKKCPYCRGELVDTVIMCHHCGKSLYRKESGGVRMIKRKYIIVGIFSLLIAVITFLLATVVFGIGSRNKGVMQFAGYFGMSLMVLGGIAVAFLLIYGIYRIYFLPWHIAKSRKHPQEQAIFILNLFLGWTFLGWVMALIWANTKQN